jgi:DMSO reductase anchor subunit
MAGVFVYGSAHWLGLDSTKWIGAFTVLACLTLFVCTAMIYASVRFLQEWASALTLVNYLLLGCASGLTLATALAAITGNAALVMSYAAAAAALTLLAWVTRAASLVRNARLKPKSSLQSAIGIKHPRIVQKAQGFMGGSFNTREFFHGQSAALLRSVKWGFLLLVFPVPLLLLGAGVSASSAGILGAAFLLQYLGLLAERWFFFAQANHPQNLYYQTIS